MLAAGVLASSRPARWRGLAAATMAVVVSGPAAADEGGVGFWLPGLYGSLAAVPGAPGWTLAGLCSTTRAEGGVVWRTSPMSI